jgi:hypothetical protein
VIEGLEYWRTLPIKQQPAWPDRLITAYMISSVTDRRMNRSFSMPR